MTGRAFRFPLAARAAVLLSLLPLPLRADMTKDQCVEANAKAQDLRRDGKLMASAEQLRLCAVASCPAMVRDDCTLRLNDVVRVQPSFVFDVKDAAGGDLIAVRVSMDGQVLADHLDGKPLKVDPGAHTFTFESAGKASVEKRLLVKEGEAGRQEPIVMADGAAAPAPGALSPGVPEGGPRSVLGTQRLLGLGLGGAGVVGVGLGAVFGLLANSAWSDAKTACGGSTSHCTGNMTAATADRSTTETDATISDIGFIAGGVLIAAGALLFFTGKPHEGSPAPPSVSLAPSMGPGQAGVTLGGVF